MFRARVASSRPIRPAGLRPIDSAVARAQRAPPSRPRRRGLVRLRCNTPPASPPGAQPAWWTLGPEARPAARQAGSAVIPCRLACSRQRTDVRLAQAIRLAQFGPFVESGPLGSQNTTTNEEKNEFLSRVANSFDPTSVVVSPRLPTSTRPRTLKRYADSPIGGSSKQEVGSRQ